MKRVDELFVVQYGHKLDMNKMAKSNSREGIAFVGRKGYDQGLSGFVAPVAGLEPYPAGLLTVALGGSRLLSTYVQQRPFYTAQNVAVLEPRDKALSLQHKLYYAMCIRHNAFRYTAFGREANRTLGTIQLPDAPPEWVDASSVPTIDGLKTPAEARIPLPDPPGASDFAIGSLFTIKKGRRVTKADRTPGGTRFIGASEKNNGVTDMVHLDPIFLGGCITVPYNGNSVGVAFYQDKPFFACDDVNVLIPSQSEDVDIYALLFVCAMIRHERFRFTYGYKWTLERMKKTTLRLPTTASGEPDWKAMSRFIRGLPFSGSVA